VAKAIANSAGDRSGGQAVADVGADESPRSRAGLRLAWVLWFVVVGLCVAGLALLLVSGGAAIPESFGFPGFTALFALTFGSVGAIVIARQPGNRVGRVLLVAGLAAAAQFVYTEYAVVGFLTAPGSLPFATVAAWLVAWAWIPFVFLAGPVLLSIFPDGRVVSARWRAGLWFAALAVGAMAVLTALQEGPLDDFPIVDNPFGLIPRNDAEALAETLAGICLSLGMLAPALSLIARYRGADQDRRQQLKWFAVAGLILGVATPLAFFGDKAGQVVAIVALCGLPIAAGIAVLRYGLYEIDTIINRALVYGLLSAVLAGLYTASIGLMQRVSHGLTGADSDAAIVLTTLIVVTAFTPIKTRLQAIVDRKFKENVDQRARIEAFTSELDSRLWPLDRKRVLTRFLEVAVAACDVAGGRIELRDADGRSWSTSTGSVVDAATGQGLLAGARDTRVRLVLGPPKRSVGMSRAAVVAVQAGLDRVVAEISPPNVAPSAAPRTTAP
jgi:hypothetical protein